MKQAHKDFYIHLDTPELLAQRSFMLDRGLNLIDDVKGQKESREHYDYITKILSDRGLPNERAIDDYKRTIRGER